jgi:hypothetical protein
MEVSPLVEIGGSASGGDALGDDWENAGLR